MIVLAQDLAPVNSVSCDKEDDCVGGDSGDDLKRRDKEGAARKGVRAPSVRRQPPSTRQPRARAKLGVRINMALVAQRVGPGVDFQP